MSEIKIKYCSEKEPDFRIYHTPWKVTNTRISYFYANDDVDSNYEGDQLDGSTKKLAKNILLIRGIVGFRLKPYEVAVKKTPAIGWDRVELQILEAINKRNERKKRYHYNN